MHVAVPGPVAFPVPVAMTVAMVVPVLMAIGVTVAVAVLNEPSNVVMSEGAAARTDRADDKRRGRNQCRD